MKQIVIRSFLQALDPTPEAEVMAALDGDGFTYDDIWKLALRAEFRLMDIRLPARQRAGFRVVALSCGDGVNPQTRVVLRRTARAWVLESSDTALAILRQRRQVRFVASPYYDSLERLVRRWGFLMSHEDLELTPRDWKPKGGKASADTVDEGDDHLIGLVL
ncbi:hypothetical protein [Aureimonas psammosilenae]|uniref:hypothetical protein n=1 Tax=Aureimonas psammosilenae TaxID=2495496 RepID=UPI0012610D21|nr:hypothetical protein [Aureimonas psammosilenae]